MLDQVLDIFKITPDFDLNVMQDRQTLSFITSKVLTGMEKIIEETKPDLVLVHGDTSTTFAAALAAFYQKVPVGHVEAGLRTYDRYSPYPEEMNRQLVSRICELYFCPTPQNKSNLISEGIRGGIYVTGNTVIDALKYTAVDNYIFENKALNSIDYSARRVVSMTAHRRENYGESLLNICRAVKECAYRYKDVDFVWPVHLSPAVRDTAFSELSGIENVILTEPVSVLDMHNLMKRSYFVLTDSGGLQEEAPAFSKPVLVMRTETERRDAVAAGTVKVVGVLQKDITDNICRLLDSREEYLKMAHAANPYGDGFACQRILDSILFHFNISNKHPQEIGGD
jgi:UDP-N-acetylglucosamine 2-epimerase (non-hydrolysing)